MKKKPDKKKTQLLEDFLDLGEKCNIKIIHDKGDFNGDNCLFCLLYTSPSPRDNR